jgi:hypothetical protein
MNRDDGVLAIVLAAEHLLDLAGLNLLIEDIERLRELGVDRLARLGPFDQHRQIVTLFPEREHQRPVLFEATPALQHPLRFGLVFPEVGCRRPRFEAAQFFVGFGTLKDNSGDRQRAC